MLMFAGGGSGSTAGGLKVTTLAILLLAVWAELRGDREPSAFGRRIPVVSIRQALTVAVLSINLVVVATVALMITNGLDLSVALFEAVSAFATVGLSTGVTPDLDLAGQSVLMPLMLMGRGGPVTRTRGCIFPTRCGACAAAGARWARILRPGRLCNSGGRR